MNIHDLLLSPSEYLAPEKTLEGLSDADAERRSEGAPHSVAEIVAHLAYWQDWFWARCSGQATPLPASAATGWPAVAAGEWPAVRTQFLDCLGRLAAMAEEELGKPVSPPIDFPPLAKFTIYDALVHVATHNAHHLGQVILLRQLMGAWPPPAGSWTW